MMDDKSKLLYNATAHIDESLIDDLVGEKATEPSAQRKKLFGFERKLFIAAAAALLAVVMIAGAVAVSYRAPEPLKEPEPLTVEPFVGEAGDYTGASFMSIADTTDTAQSVFSDRYYSVIQTYRQSAKSLSAFFDKLTKKLIDGKSSAVVSPVNVYLALSMLAECTEGSSRRQILDLIGVNSIEELREQSKLIWLYNSRDDLLGRSLLGNSVWLSSSLPVKESCTEVLKNDHYASTFTGSFAHADYKNALKQWLSDQTGGLLDDCINALEISDDTAAALVSTLYYKTQWQEGYDKTENGVFKSIYGNKDCVYNVKTVLSSIYRGSGFTAFRDMLADGNSVWFFLPDAGKSVEDLLKTDLCSFVKGGKASEAYNVTVRMPDFDVSFNASIKSVLKDLGVSDCMDPLKADFSALTDDQLYVSRVIHAARFKADKDGVEGAAYTVIDLTGGMPVEYQPYDFTLDRPFVFMVENGGAPLFVGTVVSV